MLLATSDGGQDRPAALPAVVYASQPLVAQFLESFKEYRPSQRPASFSIDQIVERLQRSFDSVQSR